MKALALALACAVVAQARAEWVQVTLTHYCPCKRCCGRQAKGVTASGLPFRPGILASDPSLPFGTRVYLDGSWTEVLDRGSDIRGNRMDLAVSTHRKALREGVREVRVWVSR